jgi:hypothetical protein
MFTIQNLPGAHAAFHFVPIAVHNSTLELQDFFITEVDSVSNAVRIVSLHKTDTFALYTVEIEIY